MTRRATLLASLLVASAGAAVAATKPLPKFDRVMTMDPPRAVGDLAMTDQNGAPRRISDLAGAPTLVFFGFTNCPDVCPTTLQQLALIKSSRAKELAGLRIAFISVDGERDTPAVMKDYLQRFPAEFVGLTAPADKCAVSRCFSRRLSSRIRPRMANTPCSTRAGSSLSTSRAGCAPRSTTPRPRR